MSLIDVYKRQLLDLARDVDVPAIAYQKPETDTFLHADMVVEGFEEVDMTFLQRVYERHFNIPWTILETERCIVRELELSDLDALFSMYAEPGMTDYMEGLYEYELSLIHICTSFPCDRRREYEQCLPHQCDTDGACTA